MRTTVSSISCCIHSYDPNIKAIGNTVDNVERKKKSGGSRPIDKPLNTTSSSKNISWDKRELKNLELTPEELIYFSSEREKSERFIDQESNISIDETLDAEFINNVFEPAASQIETEQNKLNINLSNETLENLLISSAQNYTENRKKNKKVDISDNILFRKSTFDARTKRKNSFSSNSIDFVKHSINQKKSRFKRQAQPITIEQTTIFETKIGRWRCLAAGAAPTNWINPKFDDKHWPLATKTFYRIIASNTDCAFFNELPCSNQLPRVALWAWAFTERPNNQEKSRIAENTYCRLNSSCCHSTVKNFRDKKYFQPSRFSSVTNFNCGYCNQKCQNYDCDNSCRVNPGNNCSRNCFKKHIPLHCNPPQRQKKKVSYYHIPIEICIPRKESCCQVIQQPKLQVADCDDCRDCCYVCLGNSRTSQLEVPCSQKAPSLNSSCSVGKPSYLTCIPSVTNGSYQPCLETSLSQNLTVTCLPSNATNCYQFCLETNLPPSPPPELCQLFSHQPENFGKPSYLTCIPSVTESSYQPCLKTSLSQSSTVTCLPSNATNCYQLCLNTNQSPSPTSEMGQLFPHQPENFTCGRRFRCCKNLLPPTGSKNCSSLSLAFYRPWFNKDLAKRNRLSSQCSAESHSSKSSWSRKVDDTKSEKSRASKSSSAKKSSKPKGSKASKGDLIIC
ncbi:hypothetical protein HELRODRAFT_184099 [Helobdella robusta]|uniref:Uncharacterized protein n=1 Tax=Helobdella robusta TaxID=6412 RepID=T1FKK6_HELRO|nr:hypothetical protein HELRODRAFT_184099 [Helobdella robusta]ESO07862.1 hypothetical protein HELRODRAFT_184099 [Helobdella robusta]